MTEIQFRFFLLIVFFTELLIENAVLLLTKARTSNAVTASLAIEAKRKIVTVPAILTVEATVELTTVHALVAALTFSDNQRIHTITGIIR